MCVIIVFYLFQTLDNLVGVIHAIRVVEHRGIRRDIERQIESVRLGIRLDSLENALVASFKKKPELGEKNRELLRRASCA